MFGSTLSSCLAANSQSLASPLDSRNSFKMNTYRNRISNPFRMNTYEKTGVGGGGTSLDGNRGVPYNLPKSCICRSYENHRGTPQTLPILELTLHRKFSLTLRTNPQRPLHPSPLGGTIFCVT